MTAVRASDAPYAFDNDEPTASDLLGALAATLDEFTVRRLREAGVREGARCLEVGAGAGTIAVWLAEQVGPTGRVIATDLKPQHVQAHPHLTVLRHDVVTEPLPEGPFDVIHARAVLQHLPQRREVLAKLAGALAPGGVLIVEEIEAGWSRAVLSTPDPRAFEIFAEYEKALTRVLVASGNDQTWNRLKHAAMLDLGLERVDTQGWQGSFEGGTGACLLAYAGSTELNDRLVEAGMKAEDLLAMRRLALDPRLVLRGILLLSTTGHRP
ncbi:class I SAM-dependent methyltransferase [Actinoplanes sp. LDG1-06]|uniref:Class I SAM-dependent methyltransferase n=1 Tax=Paractinoplanes ovalisporus TaxID=2810368 RepID=A0ABS2AX24_9ACTN|nr:class I SAM-dependent methyltransferase [Actinoplanes ovalisporus]MBM2623781.1 class I SAM-dependent methyltransferase [Actinoplanes ovalisporus]